MPRGDEVLLGGDLLLIEGQHSDLDVLRGMQELEIETKVPANVSPFESERLTLMDATLDPRSSLAGPHRRRTEFSRAIRHRTCWYLARGRNDRH